MDIGEWKRIFVAKNIPASRGGNNYFLITMMLTLLTSMLTH